MNASVKAEFEKTLERDAYYEEMFERRANGIEEVTFREWKRRRQEIAELFGRFSRPGNQL